MLLALAAWPGEVEIGRGPFGGLRHCQHECVSQIRIELRGNRTWTLRGIETLHSTPPTQGGGLLVEIGRGPFGGLRLNTATSLLEDKRAVEIGRGPFGGLRLRGSIPLYGERETSGNRTWTLRGIET